MYTFYVITLKETYYRFYMHPNICCLHPSHILSSLQYLYTICDCMQMSKISSASEDSLYDKSINDSDNESGILQLMLSIKSFKILSNNSNQLDRLVQKFTKFEVSYYQL